MINLLYIEWLKVSRSRYFKWMMGLWLLAFLSVPSGINYAIDWFDSQGAFIGSFLQVAPQDFPIFNYTDIWHNLAFLYKIITPLLCIIVIVNIGQEWEEKTMRQNVIDGLSRTQYFFSKTLLLILLACLSTGLLLILGLILGGAFSDHISWSAVTGHMDFLFAYFLHVFLHLCMAALFINLFRRVGVTIVIFLIYIYALEPIGLGILSYLEHQEVIPEVSHLLPMSASRNLLPVPFGKYVFQWTPEHVTFRSVWPAVMWLVFALGLNALLSVRRDLR